MHRLQVPVHLTIIINSGIGSIPQVSVFIRTLTFECIITRGELNVGSSKYKINRHVYLENILYFVALVDRIRMIP